MDVSRSVLLPRLLRHCDADVHVICVFHIPIILCVVKVWVVGPSELQEMIRSGCFGSTLQRTNAVEKRKC